MRGTNLNKDGVILYEAMAVLFIAQAHGIELDAGQLLLVALASMIAAMGVAGVPWGGRRFDQPDAARAVGPSP